IPGPDFPTAGIIMGRSGIRAAYATGRGKITVRARTEIVEKKGRFEIKVTEIPYNVNKARLIESIADLVKEKRIEGIADINDYSSMHGMYISIDLKRDANPQVVLNQLFQYTQLQSSFGVINLAIVNGVPKVLTLKEILEEYIAFQCSVIRRRTEYDLKKARDRAHILDGLARAIDIVDEIIATIRATKGGQSEAKQAIMEKFDFDDPQASAIVAFRLGQLAGLEIKKILDEQEALKEKIETYEAMLADERLILEEIKTEAKGIAEKFSDERRTEICNVSGEMDIEDLIPVEENIITLTKKGYIKRQPTDAYRVQKRGGRGISSMTQREEDVTETMFSCSSHDYVFFFTDQGRCYRLKAYEIQEASRTSRGINVVNVLPLQPEEKISALIRVESMEEEKYVCMVTRAGIIKRTALAGYKNIRKSGLIAIHLDEGDELAWVKLTSGNDDLLVATHEGMSIRFHETDARELSRSARGVKAITFKKPEDFVVGFDVLEDGGTVLTVSEQGFGRRSLPENYTVQKRGGSGRLNYRVEKYGKVAALRVVQPDSDIMLISASGIVIRIASDTVSLAARPAKGVKVMRLSEDDRLITLSAVEHLEEEPVSEEGETATTS
ncbi:MAG TPA: DNA gyrase subunit A, partial [Clostridiales bacterium]|nr:DNA gyrase subunit A [Clostridiales bacterium]